MGSQKAISFLPASPFTTAPMKRFSMSLTSELSQHRPGQPPEGVLGRADGSKGRPSAVDVEVLGVSADEPLRCGVEMEEESHLDAVPARRVQEGTEVVEVDLPLALLHGVPNDPRPDRVEPVLRHAGEVPVPVLPEGSDAAKVLGAEDEHARASLGASMCARCYTAGSMACQRRETRRDGSGVMGRRPSGGCPRRGHADMMLARRMTWTNDSSGRSSRRSAEGRSSAGGRSADGRRGPPTTERPATTEPTGSGRPCPTRASGPPARRCS